ncbi:MAG: hypothetical protein AB1543_09150, partial [Candidatus Bipolaricaulota bacterium]
MQDARGRAPYAHAIVSQNLIPDVYDRSFWVVHMDRELGIEAFTCPTGQQGDAPFLIDYNDKVEPGPERYAWITATKRVAPYAARMARVLGEAVAVKPEEVKGLLRDINMLSGRWALRMLAEHEAAVAGRAGVVLAARYLIREEQLLGDYTGGVTVLLTMDEVMRAARGEGLPISAGLAHRAARLLGVEGTRAWSDDLMVVRVWFGETPRLDARLVEVKVVSGGVPDWETATNQVRQTATALVALFGHPGRAGAPFRSSELALLLGEHRDRLAAYGMYPDGFPEGEFRRALTEIARGNYTLTCGLAYGGGHCLGEVISVEPSYPQAFFRAPEDAILRTRLGGPLLRYLLTWRDRPTFARGEIGWTEPRASAQAATEQGLREEGAVPDGGSGGAEAPLEEGTETVVTASRPDRVPGPTAGGVSATDEIGSGAVGRDAAVGGGMELPVLCDALDRALAQYRLGVEPFNPGLVQVGHAIVRMRTRTRGAQRLEQIQRLQDDLARTLAVNLQSYPDLQRALRADSLLVSQEGGFVCIDIARAEPDQVRIQDIEGR